MRIVIEPQPYRIVEWYGFTLHIPSDHTAVAADSGGWVYSYNGTPAAGEAMWMLDKVSPTTYCDICQVDLEGTDWRTTLVEYPL